MKYIFLLVPFYLFSQNNYQVKYNMLTLFDGPKNYDAKLTFSNSKSCFEYKLSAKDTATIESQDENGNLKILVADKKEKKIFTDIIKRKSSEIKYLKTRFLVEDTLSFPNWKISDEIKSISNYQCRKATTTYKGRNYIVWFTDDYPTIYGPWKLNGLPGLIIVAQDEKNEVYFETTEIIKINDKIEEPNNSFTIISPKEYQLEIKKNQQYIEERLKSMGDRNTKINTKFGKSPSIEIID